MATAEAVWGIDVGRCALTAVKLRSAADGAVDILAHEYIEHAQLLSQSDADRHALIASALEKFLSRNDISKNRVAVSVPGQHTLARFTKLPPVAPKRVPDIVRYEADQQIPFDMDEVIWDYQTFQQEDLPDIEVGIFAMKRELIREHLLHFEQASIEPVVVQPAPLAVYNAVLFDGRLKDETTIILDIGAGNTDLIIATQHGLWTRTIPIGGNHCTEALVKSFKLTFAKAENLKRTAEASKYKRQVFQAMRPVFADLVQELQRSIGFYSATHRDAQIERVFGVGNAFKLPGLQKYLQQNLGLTVDCPTAFKKAAKSSPGVQGDLAEQFLSFWVAYGLAAQAAELTKVNSNLLPTEIARQVVWRKKRPAFAAAAVCLVLAGGLVWFRQSSDLAALAANSEGSDEIQISADQARRIIDNGPPASLSPRASAATILAAGKKLKSELGQLRGQGDDERAETEELIRLQRGKALVPMIVAAIHDSLPVPEGLLGRASTQEEVLSAIQGVAREDRKQVFIQSLDVQYWNDINHRIWPDSLVEVEDPINDPEADQPGFVIKIICTTPYKDGRTFVAESFMDAVRKNGRRPGRGFYFDRVYMIEGGHFQPDPNQAGGSGRGTSGSRRASAGADMLDPVTNEPRDADWQFEIWVDAILDDFPEPEEDDVELAPEESED